jgi:hypothetical protein
MLSAVSTATSEFVTAGPFPEKKGSKRNADTAKRMMTSTHLPAGSVKLIGESVIAAPITVATTATAR